MNSNFQKSGPIILPIAAAAIPSFDRPRPQQASRAQLSGGLGNPGTACHQEVDMADEAIVVSNSAEAATSR